MPSGQEDGVGGVQVLGNKVKEQSGKVANIKLRGLPSTNRILFLGYLTQAIAVTIRESRVIIVTSLREPREALICTTVRIMEMPRLPLMKVKNSPKCPI